MKKPLVNTAYIDGANLNKGVNSLGWKLDYTKFRVWLAEKHGVKDAYLFIGLIPKHKDLYTSLQESGFKLVFKEVVYDGEGNAKGNCDADLVLHVTCDAYENKYEQAIIVSSDGDYASTVKFLNEQKKFKTLLSPAPQKKCSILLKRLGVAITYINDLESILRYK